MLNYRQGDVSLHEVQELPKEKVEKVVTEKEYVIATGEVTGHAHRLRVADSTNLHVVKDEKGRVYLQLLSDATVTHEQHASLVIKKGLYLVQREREFDPFSNSEREVND